MRTIRELVIELAIMLVIGVLLAALGPFGSFDISFAARVAYWLPAVLIGYAIFRPTILAAVWMSHRLQLSRTLTMYAASLLAAAPATVAIGLLGGYRVSRDLPFEAFLQLYSNVALVGLVIGTVFLLVEAMRVPRAAVAGPVPQPPVVAPPPSPRFLERLPTSWNGALKALEMEDHYVRAHGPNGASELILMRMRDAEAELAGIEGERVHRSWWVARAAVTGRRREGRNLSLVLDGGLVAPVARDRVADLKAKGWL